MKTFFDVNLMTLSLIIMKNSITFELKKHNSFRGYFNARKYNFL